MESKEHAKESKQTGFIYEEMDCRGNTPFSFILLYTSLLWRKYLKLDAFVQKSKLPHV